ncbi:hypothetical protein MITS9509_01008 [Synechococcus sp. MIT S9509]|nr:hypothetical protein MITS9504_00572 [Synechococcus sp. MIT S9504]KZR92559.1 hypothetical protein MITS9509_01008 [Synechococcus sp. MIT S9509]
MRSRLLNDVVDPPTIEVNGGGNEDRAPVEPAADGGISGLILPTLWKVLTDTAEEVPIQSSMTELNEHLEDSPRFRRGQISCELSDLQRVLEESSHQSTGDETVSIPVGTVVILAHCLLRHQPYTENLGELSSSTLCRSSCSLSNNRCRPR